MKEFIEYIAKQLVDKPESVIAEETSLDEQTIELTTSRLIEVMLGRL